MRQIARFLLLLTFVVPAARSQQDDDPASDMRRWMREQRERLR